MARGTDDGILRITIEHVVNRHAGEPRISPNWVATEAMHLLDPERVAPRAVYLGCHLHMRQLAREQLRGKYETGKDDDSSDQHDLFPGLQKRYPAAKSSLDDPVYILLEEMTETDVGWNIARLRAEAGAKLRHADALKAWWDQRPGAAA